MNLQASNFIDPLSSRVESMLLHRLKTFVDDASAGFVWPREQMAYRCFADQPNLVRRPSLSYVHANRFSLDHLREGTLTIRPDLVVFVVSDTDLMRDVDAQVEEFLAVNVPLVWVIDPACRLAFVHRKDGSIAKLMTADSFSGEDILLGFECRLAGIFVSR